MKEPSEIPENWIQIADHDLGTAKIIFTNIPEYYDIISFHCQQAAEKYLKGVLIFLNIPFDKKHDLLYLIDLMSDAISVDNIHLENAFKLNNFAVQIRYPNFIIKPTNEDLELNIGYAENFRIFAQEIIGFK